MLWYEETYALSITAWLITGSNPLVDDDFSEMCFSALLNTHGLQGQQLASGAKEGKDKKFIVSAGRIGKNIFFNAPDWRKLWIMFCFFVDVETGSLIGFYLFSVFSPSYIWKAMEKLWCPGTSYADNRETLMLSIYGGNLSVCVTQMVYACVRPERW